MEHEILIKNLNAHLYLKSEKSRQKRTKLAQYMADDASLGGKGLALVHFCFRTVVICTFILLFGGIIAV